MLRLRLTANSIDTDSQVTFYFNSLFHNTVDWKWLAFVDRQGLVGIDPATIQLAVDPQQVACPNCGHDVLDYFEDGSYECPDCELYIAPEKAADDPRKAMSEHEVLTRVQAMGEESLSPDNFEGLMRALEALKTTRNVDAGSDDPRKQMLDEIRQQINGLPGTDYSCAGDTVYIHQEVNRKRVSEIIDEMEAKL